MKPAADSFGSRRLRGLTAARRGARLALPRHRGRFRAEVSRHGDSKAHAFDQTRGEDARDETPAGTQGRGDEDARKGCDAQVDESCGEAACPQDAGCEVRREDERGPAESRDEASGAQSIGGATRRTCAPRAAEHRHPRCSRAATTRFAPRPARAGTNGSRCSTKPAPRRPASIISASGISRCSRCPRRPAGGVRWVSVGYERVRGLREKHESCDGEFQATLSKTFSVPLFAAFAAWADASIRGEWLDAPDLSFTKLNAGRNIRARWPDGSLLDIRFNATGPDRCQIVVDTMKLNDGEAVQQAKAFWQAQFERLQHYFRV